MSNVYLVIGYIMFAIGGLSRYFDAAPIVFWSCLIIATIYFVGSTIISTIEKNAK